MNIERDIKRRRDRKREREGDKGRASTNREIINIGRVWLMNLTRIASNCMRTTLCTTLSHVYNTASFVQHCVI